MTEPLQHSRAAVVLMNEAALDVPVETLDVSGDVRFVVAGSSLVKMTLAELCLPGAQMIWTDFRQSSLAAQPARGDCRAGRA